ncbi:MAG: hypothetical protein ACTHKE_04325 [Sphingomicrobium sp.]
MKVIRKDATIQNTGSDDEFPGKFRVVLSAPTKDRDGDTLRPEEWKQPLPDHITFDQDHLMSVAGTVGSGKPTIDEKTGHLVVEGTYSSLPRAQEVRTLVNEGHINRTSVAFMTERVPQKDGTHRIQRELLNGAFVAIPSNREAVVLDSKGLKAGARNSAADAEKIQGIHDHAAALGADCSAAKSLRHKDADTNDDNDPIALIAATDAALDQAIDLLSSGEVEQALAVLQAADAAIDECMELLGIPDPDDGEGGESETGAAPDGDPGAAKAAPGSKSGAAPTSDDTELQQRALRYRALSRLASI